MIVAAAGVLATRTRRLSPAAIEAGTHEPAHRHFERRLLPA